MTVLAVTPHFIRVAHRRGIGLAVPGARKVHSVPVPQIGGMAFLLALFSASWFMPKSGEALTLTIGMTSMFLIGLMDDLFEVPALVRLLLQMVVAAATYFAGIALTQVRLPVVGVVSLGPLSLVITVLWLAGTTNAVNFVDGLDGLAAGISAIASFMFLVLGIGLGSEAAILFFAALMLGVSLSFLWYNFHPAKVFMGDGGAYFLGYGLACLSLLGPFKGAASLTILIPFLVLAVPLADMFTAVLRRLLHGQSPARPDRQHLHHRFLNLGLNQAQTVFLMYLFALSFATFSLLVAL